MMVLTMQPLRAVMALTMQARRMTTLTMQPLRAVMALTSRAPAA